MSTDLQSEANLAEPPVIVPPPELIIVSQRVDRATLHSGQ